MLEAKSGQYRENYNKKIWTIWVQLPIGSPKPHISTSICISSANHHQLVQRGTFFLGKLPPAGMDMLAP